MTEKRSSKNEYHERLRADIDFASQRVSDVETLWAEMNATYERPDRDQILSNLQAERAHWLEKLALLRQKESLPPATDLSALEGGSPAQKPIDTSEIKKMILVLNQEINQLKKGKDTPANRLQVRQLEADIALYQKLADLHEPSKDEVH